MLSFPQYFIGHKNCPKSTSKTTQMDEHEEENIIGGHF